MLGGGKGEDARVGAYLRQNSSPGDSLLVGFGHSNVYVDAEMRERKEESLASTVETLVVVCDMAWIYLYYTKERIWSAEARREWVEPDVKALDF